VILLANPHERLAQGGHREPTEIDARETMPRFALSSRLTLRGEQQPRLFKLEKWPSARSHRKGLLCSSVFPRFPGFASSIKSAEEPRNQTISR